MTDKAIDNIAEACTQKDSHISQLHNIFPNIDKCTIQDIYESNGGQLEPTVIDLLKDSNDSSSDLEDNDNQSITSSRSGQTSASTATKDTFYSSRSRRTTISFDMDNINLDDDNKNDNNIDGEDIDKKLSDELKRDRQIQKDEELAQRLDRRERNKAKRSLAYYHKYHQSNEQKQELDNSWRERDGRKASSQSPSPSRLKKMFGLDGDSSSSSGGKNKRSKRKASRKEVREILKTLNSY
ncbi:hypothetical protein H4219_004258 [Mycoemilia scoparia]|uniref:CUE domain-containing protein n=1 Tax=Mycoemilia scoparia TaxID=417184 RepID=A0A9W7ZY25_9FUNG|nr:hypothetical protein H4219_004258 [Mycoemilia scoparia]